MGRQRGVVASCTTLRLRRAPRQRSEPASGASKANSTARPPTRTSRGPHDGGSAPRERVLRRMTGSRRPGAAGLPHASPASRRRSTATSARRPRSNVIAFQSANGLTPNGVVSCAVALRCCAVRSRGAGSTGGPVGDGDARTPTGLATAPAERAAADQGRDRRRQQDRVQAVHLRRRPRQLERLAATTARARSSYALHGAGLLSSPEDSTRVRVLRQPRARAAGSRSRPTPATSTCTSPGLWFDTAAQSRRTATTAGRRPGARRPAGFVVRHPGRAVANAGAPARPLDRTPGERVRELT